MATLQTMDPTSRPISPDELFQHADFLRRVARGLIRDEHRAEDVVQDTLVAALTSPPRRREALRGWLSRVVRQRALNLFRGEERRAGRENDVARSEPQESHEEALERLELQRLVFDLVLDQPEERRTVLYLRYYEGLGPTAIAKRLGVPVKTVKSRLSRGLETLRVRLDSRFDGDRSRWIGALVPIAFPPGVPIGAPPGGGEALPIVGAGGLLVKAILLTGAACAALLVAFLALRNDDPTLADELAGTNVELPVGELTRPMAAEESARVEAPPTSEGDTARQPVSADEDSMPMDRGALEVRVTWSDDTPAAGVGLAVRCDEDPAPREELFAGRSDARGVACFPRLFAGDVELFVDRDYHRYEASVVAGSTATTTIRIPEGNHVRGRVVTPEGVPIAGAEIWLGRRGYQVAKAARATRTDSAGAFALAHLGPRTCLSARADGWTPSVSYEVVNLPVEDSTRTITITLGEAGGAVRGRVLDPGGEPVAGATLAIGKRGGYIIDLPSGMRGTAPHPVPVFTGSDGTFVCPGGLSFGAQAVQVSARGFPVFSGSVEVQREGVTEIEIRLAKPATIVGRVLHADGLPGVGASLIAGLEGHGRHASGLPGPRAISDEEGRYRLEWVHPGSVEVSASMPQDARAGLGRAKVLVHEGEEHELELSLSRGKTIIGTVVDAHGDALVGWTIYAESALGMQEGRQDRTDEYGSFLLANLGERYDPDFDQEYNLAVAAPGEIPIPPRAELKGVTPGSEDVVLVVGESVIPDVMINGLLLDADGSAPADVKLVYLPHPGLRGLFMDFDLANGAFSYGPVRAERFRLKVYRGGLSRVVALTPWLESRSGETIDVGTIRIEPQGRVEVVLARLEGLPVDLELSLSRDGSVSEKLLLEDGVHRSRELLPGTWMLHPRHGGEWSVRPQPVEVVSGRTVRVTADFVQQVRVSITIRPEGASEGWSTCSLRVVEQETDATLVQRDYTSANFERGSSRTRLELPEGRYRVVAELDDGRRGELELEIDPLSPPEEPFELPLK